MSEHLSVNQAAEQLAVSARRIRVLCEQGRLPATKVGWSWLIRKADLDAYRKRRERA
jgi:excisionase family DNA binding protein